ncbi:MAG: glycosyltransferase 87 family protein [Gaiellaceae bacterium]
MSLRSESSYRPAEVGQALLAAAFGLACLGATWVALHLSFFDRFQIIDTPVYQGYGEGIADGQVPYRDFALEYPPGALPFFWAPTLAPADHYETVFELLMLGCAAAAVLCFALALSALGASSARLYGAAAFAGLAPLALGSVVLTRYDLWPAALTAAALAALVSGREGIGMAALGLGTAAKLYPAVLVPVALAFVWRRRGGRAAAWALGAFLAVVALVVAPFAVVAPEGLVDSVERQLGRPLQVESLGASLLLAAHQLGAYAPTIVSTHGSQNLAGTLPDALAAAQTVLQAAALVVVWILAAARPLSRERLLAASAASVVAFVAFGKVLSPQFLIWLIPLVPLVGGGAGLAAAGLLGAALVTTHLWFPFNYWEVVALESVGWLVVVRDLLLLALFGVLAVATARGPGAPRSV